MARGWRIPDVYTIGERQTSSGGAADGGGPAGHRFIRSPRHRSVLRAGAGGKDIQTIVVSGRGHRFTAPDGYVIQPLRGFAV